MKADLLVVGAGLAGATVAERVAAELGWDVLVVERRTTIGGNAADGLDPAGILVQHHGPHIFHTRHVEVWAYVTRFARFNDYVHRVQALVNGRLIYLPLNLESAEILFDRSFDAESWEAFLSARRVPLGEIRNSRDVALTQVGEELYEWIYRGYTRKQWGVDPEHLGPEVLSRLPVRFDRDTRYFAEPYQGIPEGGYSAMVERMLASPRVHLMLDTDYADVRGRVERRATVYTGAVDDYFDGGLGRLPYRAIEFEWETLGYSRHQDAAVVNYPQTEAFTRVTEFKHFTRQEHPHTTICREYPNDVGEPYYPIPGPASRTLAEAYAQRAAREPDTFFVGRLAQYRYLNMDQAVLGGLATAAEIIKRYGR